MSTRVGEEARQALATEQDPLARERAALAAFPDFRARAPGDLPDHRRIRIRPPGDLPPALRDDRAAYPRAASGGDRYWRPAPRSWRGTCLGDHGDERLPGPQVRDLVGNDGDRGGGGRRAFDPAQGHRHLKHARWAGAAPAPARASDIEVGDVECVVLDEFAARLDEVAHQAGEESRRSTSASSTLTWRSARLSGSSVVSHNWSAFISPRPL